MREGRLARIAPIVVGMLLLAESAAILFFAMVLAVVGSLVGALAFLAGAGGATDEQITQGFAMIVVTIVSPFVAGALVGAVGLLLMFRIQRRLVIGMSVFAIVAQIAFHRYVQEGLHPAEIVLLVLHVAAVAVGFLFVPPPATKNRLPATVPVAELR